MIKELFFNGSFVRVEKDSSKDIEQMGNAIIMASNEGWSYRGKPEDMARDAIYHINGLLGYDIGLFPVLLSSKSGINDEGEEYTTEVIFQAVF